MPSSRMWVDLELSGKHRTGRIGIVGESLRVRTYNSSANQPGGDVSPFICQSRWPACRPMYVPGFQVLPESSSPECWITHICYTKIDSTREPCSKMSLSFLFCNHPSGWSVQFFATRLVPAGLFLQPLGVDWSPKYGSSKRGKGSTPL